jgi:pimeloyl-ACP methyl ester carboxylesterase
MAARAGGLASVGGMPRLPLVAVALVAAALLTPVAPAGAKVRTGPAGTAFYRPPSPLPKGTHGTAIWARRLTGDAALSGARTNELLLYRSVGVTGKPVAVSGTVSLPKGKAPKGGWPVVTWGHGTTGIADVCAPSRDSASNPAHGLIAYIDPLLTSFLKRGYAVVRTDYEGLGTPGDHPFLNGDSEGRDMLDIVRAARKLEPSLGKRVIIAGHSQGGQAALFAASLAKKWTPELSIRGTVAFAPVSHLSEQVPLVRGLKDPSPLTAFAVMIARGIDLADPALKVSSLLSPTAAARYSQVSERCLGQLRDADSFGNVAPADIFRSDADLNPLAAALDRADDAENLTIRTPLRIEQGTADTTVLPPFTDQLAQTLTKRGTPLVYKKYDGVDHGGIVVSAATDARSFLRSRLK